MKSKSITKKDCLVMQFMLAELSRMKQAGIDDGEFRGVSVHYSHQEGSQDHLVMIITPGRLGYHHEMVLVKINGDWHPRKAWFCTGTSRQEV